MAKRVIDIEGFGPVTLRAFPRPNPDQRTVGLYAEFMKLALNDPPGAKHKMMLYPAECRRLAWALLEMAAVSEGADPWPEATDD